MNVFEAVKEAVTTRQAAEAFGIPVRRNGMCLCPFHNDKNPSMKVDRRFHCFGCQADGDVIDFTAKLYGLTGKEAAVKLAADFGIRYDVRGHDPPVKKPVMPKISEELRQRQSEQKYFRIYANYLHLMEDWKIRYAPRPEDADWHPLFVEALQNQSYVEYLLDTLLSGTKEEKAAVMADKEKEVAALERRLSGFRARDWAERGEYARTGTDDR